MQAGRLVKCSAVAHDVLLGVFEMKFVRGFRPGVRARISLPASLYPPFPGWIRGLQETRLHCSRSVNQLQLTRQWHPFLHLRL